MVLRPWGIETQKTCFINRAKPYQTKQTRLKRFDNTQKLTCPALNSQSELSCVRFIFRMVEQFHWWEHGNLKNQRKLFGLVSVNIHPDLGGKERLAPIIK